MRISNFVKTYVYYIRKLRFLVIAFWLLMVILGLVFGTKFFDATTSEFTAPEDSEAQKATDTLVKYFPAQKDIHTCVVWMGLDDQYDSTSESLAEGGSLYDQGFLFDSLLQDKIYKHYEAGSFIKGYSSYYSFMNLSLPDLAEGYIQGNNKSVLADITFSNKDRDDVMDFIDDLKDYAKDSLKEAQLKSMASVQNTGVDYFQEDILAGAEEDMATMDKMVLPLALLILACVVQNLPLMVLPLVCIFTTMLTEFLIMYPVALSMNVVSFCPSFMMSLTYAMSIDYSLFMLSRFTEELRRGRSIHRSVEAIVESAGHTIGVSGSTLTLCFLGMVFFPMDLLQSVGIGSSVALICALSVNLSLTPALLFVLTPFIMKIHSYVNLEKLPFIRQEGREEPKYDLNLDDNYERKYKSWKLKYKPLLSTDIEHRSSSMFSEGTIEDEDEVVLQFSNRAHDNMTQGLLFELNEDLEDAREDPYLKPLHIEDPSYGREHSTIVPHDLFSHEEVFKEDDNMAEVVESKWYRMGTFLMKPVQAIILLILIVFVTVPVDKYALDVETTIGFDSMVPHDSDSWEGFREVSKSFGEGSLSVYRIVFEMRDSETSVFTNSTWNEITDVMVAMVDSLDYTSIDGFTAPFVLNGQTVSYDEMVEAIAAVQAGTATDFQRAIATLASNNIESVSHAQSEGRTYPRSMYAYFELGEDPYSIPGTDWLVDCRDLFDDLMKTTPFKIYLAYGATVEYDAVDAVYDMFPVMITVTLCVVFLLMGLAFKSVVAPIRSVGSIILTLVFCYGFAVLTYQEGALKWIGVQAFDNQGALAWLPPVMCFSIIVGLGLDYDVFLISRVLEFRLHGYTNSASIVKGLYKTGHIITAAGVIMAVAFSGLLLSSEIILNQVAFFLVSAVLLDTFVIRTVLVPVLLGLSGKRAWWPHPNVPDGVKSYGYQH